MRLVSSWRWLICTCVAVLCSGGTALAQSVTLTWEPSVDPAVVGYIVYSGIESGVYTSQLDVGAAMSVVYGVVPEQRYFFAVASYTADRRVGVLSPEVSGSAHAVLTLDNPGDQTSVVGQPAMLRLHGADSFGTRLTYLAYDLPPGLLLDPVTGVFSGTPVAAGAYRVIAMVSNGLTTSTVLFTWTTVAPSSDITAPAIEVTLFSPTRTWTGDAFLTLGGATWDDVGVTSVTWSSDRGDRGDATGTDTWITGIPLYSGRNVITVTAVDGAGNRGTTAVSLSVY